MANRNRRKARQASLSVERRFERALSRHDAGEFRGAEEDYAAVTSAAPTHDAAWHAFGVLALQMGRPTRAVERIQRAVDLAPENAEYLANLGASFDAMNRWPEARQAFERALAIEPNDVDANFNLGLVLVRLGEFVSGATALEKACALAPKDPEIWLNLAIAERRVGARVKSSDSLTTAEQLAGPNSPLVGDLMAERGAAAWDDECYDEALTHYENALARRPNEPRFITAIATLSHVRGDIARAEREYRRSLALQPSTDVTFKLGRLYEQRGDLSSALQAFRQVVAERPTGIDEFRALTRVLRFAFPSERDREVRGWLVRGYAEPQIDPDDLSRAAAAQLRLELSPSLKKAEPAALLEAALAASDLLIPFLIRSINLDPAFEPVLMRCRDAMAMALASEEPVGSAVVALGAAFSVHAFNNEYVWEEAGEQASATPTLDNGSFDGEAADANDLQGGRTQRDLLRYALFAPLDTLAFPVRNALAAAEPDGTSTWNVLIERTVREPAVEREMANSLATIGAEDNDTSTVVRTQYEESPYPRWIDLADAERPDLIAYLSTEFPAAADVFGAVPQPFRALVAGCGTGQEPIRLALGSPQSHVVGVDLSRASLGYAARMAGHLGVQNLELVQGDLVSVAALGRFDVIVCNGVLHHMEDPFAGLAALLAVLEPAGVMKVGLYSEAARQAIVEARALIAEQGYRADAPGIRRFRADVLNGRYPSLDVLAQSEDFYTMSTCRDLVFHECEHRFTLAVLEAHLTQLDLTFLGMEGVAPVAYERFASTPQDLSQMQRWALVEAAHPETFQGMYQFWVGRGGRD